jgi:acyl-CoA reductase-like NAD-dependent aldehyde dehydrogenase
LYISSDFYLTFPLRAQATQEVVSRLPLTTAAEFNAAVQAAKDAFPKWRNTPISARQRIMLKYQHLIREHMVSRSPYHHHATSTT